MSKEIKSIEYAEKHGLAELIQYEDGVLKVDKHLHEKLCLEPSGITVDQFKKLQAAEAELLPAVVYVGGEKAATAFRENSELVEIGLNYQIGKNTQAGALYHREHKDHVAVFVETKHKSAEMSRVLSAINTMFDEINN